MKHSILILFLTLFLSSCFEERIELDLNESNKRLVVNAWITDLDKPQYVNLSYSVNYLGRPAPEYINNAEVLISTALNNYTLENKNNGNYFLPNNWLPEIGATYSLKIMHDGVSYEATQVMRPCPEIEEAKFDLFEFDDVDTIDLYETVFAFQEIIGEGDAYFAIDYKKGSVDGDSLYNGGYANDEFIDGEYFDDIRVSEDDRLFTEMDTAVIELHSLGNETFEYLTDIESEVFRGSPFDPPPANVRSNISNGALGYFIMAGAKSVELFR